MADAHLVGSMNLETAEDVFRTVAEVAGPSVTRIPDGETGPRSGWIFHQIPRLAANPALEPGPSVPNRYVEIPAFRLRQGVSPQDVVFDLGFGVTAVESYPVFARLKAEGVIAPHVKFQVAIPTQVAVFGNFISLEDQPRLMEVYETQLAEQVAMIAAAVPHEELAIQWDVATELAVIEGVIDSVLDTDGLLDQVARMARMVPEDVELGFHLCYGDAPLGPEGAGQHFVQPADAGNLVLVANGIAERISRPIAFLQMPVPIDRDDDAYFAPLDGLRLHPETRLFLGLIHHQDGAEGARRRIAAAARHVAGFGVATECGMANKPREAVPELLALQAQAEVPPAVPVL
jgi:hypothetical protein